MIKLNVGYVSYDDIALEAESFLKDNDITGIPIDIEHIIEFNYDMNIIDIPNLQRDYDVEGFIAADFSSIYVDEFISKRRNYRYRFTLSHEIGHYILHKKYLEQYQFTNVIEWKQFQKQIDPSDWGRLEIQGYDFGGLALVPRYELRRAFDEYLPDISPMIRKAQDHGVKRKDYIQYAIEQLARLISPRFDVSADVVIKRISFDKLDEEI